MGEQIQPKGQRGMRFPCSPEPKEGGKSLQPVKVAVWSLRVFSTSIIVYHKVARSLSGLTKDSHTLF